MVRRYWLATVSALLALAGQAGAQSPTPAQPTTPNTPVSPTTPAPTAGPQEQVISVREMDKPVQKCRILSTTRQADGSLAWKVESLDSHEKMMIVESIVVGPQGSKTTMTRIIHLPGDKAPATSTTATATEPQPSPTPTPKPASRPWFNWHWFSATTPATSNPSNTTAPSVATPVKPLQARTNDAVAPPVPDSLPATLTARSNPQQTAAQYAQATPSPTTETPQAQVAPEWRQSWGAAQSAPVDPTPAVGTRPRSSSTPAYLPVAVDHGVEDPLLQFKSNTLAQGLSKEGDANRPAGTGTVTSGTSVNGVPVGESTSPGTSGNALPSIPPPPAWTPPPATTPPASKPLFGGLFGARKAPAPTPVDANAGPMVPPGLGSVVAVQAPELMAPPPHAMQPPPITMSAYEPNAFSEPVKPADPEPSIPPRPNGAASVPPSLMARLPHGQPGGPPLPPDPNGMAMQARMQFQGGYSAGQMMPAMGPMGNYPTGQMMAMPTTMAEPSMVRLTGGQLPLEGSTGQFSALLRESNFPSQREWAATQLGTMNWRADPGVVLTLIAAARGDMAPLVRAACVRSLSIMTGSPLPVTDTLAVLRQDPDAQVRQEAERAMEKVGR